jgi:hypothetical protein
MNARAKPQPGVDAGMTTRDWIWRNGKLHGRNGIPRSERDRRFRSG